MKKLLLISLAFAVILPAQTKIIAGAGGSSVGGGSIATTSNALVGDGAGGAVAASGTGTDCLLVDGTSATCGAVTAANVEAISAAGADGCITPAVDGAAIEYPFDETCLLSQALAWTGLQTFTPPSAQAIDAVGDSISATSNIEEIDPDADYTLTSTPTIANGTDGQVLDITNIDSAFTVTLQGEDDLASSNICGGDNITIGPRQTRRAIYTTGLGCWSFLSGGPAASTPLASPYRVYTIRPDTWICTGVTTAGANRVRGYYFNVENDMTAATLSAMYGTAGGASTEWAFGLYDTAGTRICQSGALSAVAGNAQTDATCSANITKGTYIIAWGGENTTMRFCGLSLGSTVGGFFFGAGGAPFGAVDFPVGDAFSDTTGLPATLDIAGKTRLGDVSVLGAMLH